MVTLRLEFRPSLEDKAASFRQLAQTGLYEGLGRLANEVEEVVLYTLRDEAPVYSGPDPRRAGGGLRDSITSKQRAHYGGGITLEFTAVDYAKYVIYDTRPHEIWPVQAKCLAFYDADGQLVFRPHVSHPGTKANPFHERAWDRAKADVLDILSRTGREIIERVL